MALDKLVDSSLLNDALENTADVIREKLDSSSSILFDYGTLTNAGFANAVNSIVTLEEGTASSAVSSGQTAASASDIKTGKSAWVDGVEVKGSLGNTSILEGTTTVSGSTAARGTATWGNGVIASGEMGAATFANEGSSGKNYIDISSTTSAPVLVSGDYLYINKGYTDDLKISLAKLVPDGSDVKNHSDYILSGHSAYDDDGTLVAGSIPTIASTDLTVDGKTVTVPIGYYTGSSGAAAVSADVADGDYSASVVSASVNKKPTVTYELSGSVTNIGTETQPEGVDGTDYWTITPSGTVTSGTARSKATATISTAGYIEAGSKTTSSYKTVTISSTVTEGTNRYIVKGTATQNAPTVDSSGLVTATSTVTAGYQGASTPSNTLQLSTQSGATITPTESEQTVVASGKYTTGEVKVGAISSTYVGSTIPQNDSEDLVVSENVVTAPAGYYSVNASATIPLATITSGTADMTGYSMSEGSDPSRFIITNSVDISAPTVDVAGYISSTKGTKNVNIKGATFSASLPKIRGTFSISETKKKPVIEKQDVPNGVIQAASGNATTVEPSSGVYIAVKSSENVSTITPSFNLTQQGYGTDTKHGLTSSGASVGAAASDMTYIPITTATPVITGGVTSGNASASSSTASISDAINNSGVSFTAEGTASRAKLTYDGAVSGFVIASNGSDVSGGGATSATAITSKTYYINGVTLTAPSSGTRTFSVTVPNGETTATFVFNVDTSGNVAITES